MSIQAIGERVVAKEVKIEEKTQSGIILSGMSNKKNPNVVEVVGIGSGEKVSKEISVGDKIIHSGYGITKVNDNNEEFLIIDFENILGIIK
ncbi:molecular chaperone GroES [Fusobacterium perfoetens]|uniref:molecular chaperone GroES n=1 Tax=Fusobacterium perfoetens TaxID=852 RepID=UPI0004891531|nr:molecular chaperone GroES [Fusobacterium perfoetens]MCI6152948.1 co-chaperone GroES [Fusobacterium perfoetens]MDY3237360.1 co-chaperone GroES [Fusobacterium perfoetens]